MFDNPTLVFSQSGIAVAHEVLPTMHLLRFRLEAIRSDVDNVLQPVTRIAAQAALTTLNKYFGVMERSNICWMATGMSSFTLAFSMYYLADI